MFLTHPGRTINGARLDALGLNVADSAAHFGVERSTLSRLLSGHSGISADMAIRLEKAGCSNADRWLRLQAAYALDEARKCEDEIHVERIGTV